jgi:hypothetical protein
MHVIESYLDKFIWRRIRRRSGKTMRLKATPQKIRCMILIGNLLGGNFVENSSSIS